MLPRSLHVLSSCCRKLQPPLAIPMATLWQRCCDGRLRLKYDVKHLLSMNTTRRTWGARTTDSNPQQFVDQQISNTMSRAANWCECASSRGARAPVPHISGDANVQRLQLRRQTYLYRYQKVTLLCFFVVHMNSAVIEVLKNDIHNNTFISSYITPNMHAYDCIYKGR